MTPLSVGGGWRPIARRCCTWGGEMLPMLAVQEALKVDKHAKYTATELESLPPSPFWKQSGLSSPSTINAHAPSIYSYVTNILVVVFIITAASGCRVNMLLIVWWLHWNYSFINRHMGYIRHKIEKPLLASMRLAQICPNYVNWQLQKFKAEPQHSYTYHLSPN